MRQTDRKDQTFLSMDSGWFLAFETFSKTLEISIQQSIDLKGEEKEN